MDSGGVLNGVLLRAGLVDEIRLLVHPELVGGEVINSIFQESGLGDEDAPIKLQLDNMEKIKDDIIYLKYKVFTGMLK
jgi:2,5-diamino-6-(ribosylamino)-4(3H)-pyrimidinone 5'-phosphate reductase